jgi:hypothetical protein
MKSAKEQKAAWASKILSIEYCPHCGSVVAVRHKWPEDDVSYACCGNPPPPIGLRETRLNAVMDWGGRGITPCPYISKCGEITWQLKSERVRSNVYFGTFRSLYEAGAFAERRGILLAEGWREKAMERLAKKREGGK